MKYRTLVQARARKSPGLSGEVATLVPADALLTPVGGPSHADGLVWYPFQINGGQAWIAEATPSQTPILLLEADDPTIFDLAFAFVMAREGGYLSPDDAQTQGDPGGETKYGISKRAYPNLDIAGLTRVAAKHIYLDDYWVKSGAANLAWPLNVIHFDTSVNCGIARANTFLADCAGSPGTYLALRLAFYERLSTFQTFGAGWVRRVDALRKLAGV